MISPLDLAEPELQRKPFTRKGWIFELKYDGFRILATHAAGSVRMLSRRGTAYHDLFPELVGELALLPELAIDGELEMLDAQGGPQFGELVGEAIFLRAVNVFWSVVCGRRNLSLQYQCFMRRPILGS